jgi:hypothetical protein
VARLRNKDIKPHPLPELLLRYQWGFRYLFIIIIRLNNIFLQILLQDKYNIGTWYINKTTGLCIEVVAKADLTIHIPVVLFVA